MLTAAALIGRGFRIELLKKITDLSENSLVDALDRAEKAMLISTVAHGTSTLLVFSHELIRQTLVQSLSLPRQQQLHAGIAGALEEIYADSLEDRAPELAHHFYLAGAFVDPSKATYYLKQAGDRALDTTAFEDALRLYEKAFELQPAAEELERADLHYKHGLALRSLERLDEAVVDWHKSLAIYENLGETEIVGGICATISSDFLGAQRWMEASEIIQRGLSVLGDSVNEARCLLLAASGFVASYLPGVGYDYASGMFNQALQMAGNLGADQLQGPILVRKGALHHIYWQGNEEADVGLSAAKKLRFAGDLYGAALALAYGQCGLIRTGKFDEAAKVGGEAKALAQRTGNHAVEWFTDAMEEKRNVLATGDLYWYEGWANAQLDKKQKGVASWIEYDYTSLGMAQFWLGRWKEARESFRKGAEQEIPGMTVGHCIGSYFVFMSYLNDKAAALPIIEERQESFPERDRLNPLDSWALLDSAIEGLAVLGERNKVAELYPLALDAISTGNILRPNFAGSVQTLAGIAAAAAELWDAAEDHFKQSLHLADTIPLRIDQPEARRWYANMLIQRDAPGDKAEAWALLNEAVAMYRGVGMPRHMELAEAQLEKL